MLKLLFTSAFVSTLTLLSIQKEQQEAREVALAAQEDTDEDEAHNSQSKSARAYAKTYKPGPPLVPAIIVDRITKYISRINLRKRGDFLLMVCKYWSLKREARRGAPLLKRLHLEPWTAASSGKLQSEEDRVMKLEVSVLGHLEEWLDVESFHSSYDGSKRISTSSGIYLRLLGSENVENSNKWKSSRMFSLKRFILMNRGSVSHLSVS